ncbi:MAG: hypothetical protein QM779_15905 [Propionicimonas sp.]|uniref:hypothetical protein n=1 Tax=Propionicimonas sp. TaxID=1955623 RepID=UPI003D121AE3
MTTLLHRFSVKPHHLDAYLPVWEQEVAVRTDHGFQMHRAFVETDAEPKLTWLYSHPDPAAGEAGVRADPRAAELDARKAGHVFGNVKVRPVRVEVLNPPGDPGRTVVMRRYSIVGEWTRFLAIWRRVVSVRERYGFDCQFAVADQPENMFTWAFAFDGEWPDFAEAQRPYYHDPERVALRGVFDFMADYDIHPARELPLPAGLSGA